MLEVRGLDVSPGGTRVLRGIELSLAMGEVVTLQGHPDSGKTLLVRALCGLVPAAGRILFHEQEMVGAEYTAMVQAGLIHVPQDGLVFPNLVVRDNLLLGATVRGRARRQVRLAEVLEMLPPLQSVMERRAGALDRAMQQVVSIGRGLMALPKLLVLDDPGSVLDDAQRALLAALIDRLSLQGLPVLLTGRRTTPPLATDSRICLLEDGRLSRQGSNPW